MESVDCVVALVWKLPERETQRVGGNKIYTLVYKLDPGTTAGFSTLRVQSVCPSVARGPVSTLQCVEKQVRAAMLEDKS